MSTSLASGWFTAPVGEMHELEYANPGKVAETIMAHRDITTGVKVRQGAFQVGNNGVEPLKLAIEAAERFQHSCDVPYRFWCAASRCVKIDAFGRYHHPLFPRARRWHP